MASWNRVLAGRFLFLLAALAILIVLPGVSSATVQSNVTRLTTDPAYEFCPDFSPSGQQIAFLRWAELWVMNVDGTQQMKLSDGPVNCGFQWAPDSKRIVFVKRNDAPGVFDVSLKTGVERQLAYDPDTVNVSVSTDGKQIAFDGSSNGGYFQIFTMNADGGDLRSVTSEIGYATQPAFSPNGRQIAFFDGTGISVMNADGSNVHHLAMPDLLAQFPAWSPNGKEILFAAYSTIDWTSDRYVVDADGSGLINISNLVNASPYLGDEVWSHDGRIIAFDVYPLTIYIANADGSNRQFVTQGFYPQLSPNGRLLVFSGAPDSEFPFDICVVALK